MIYARGQSADYDFLGGAGQTRLGLGDVPPYFKRAENNERGADAWHGSGGR